jgi:AcrR family transcriptional regulator
VATTQPIGRGAHARRRVMAAALDQLAAEGSAGFTMESVARRAGASKATLYRHWTSASALLVDAMTATFQPLPPPAGGDVHDDLAALLTRAAELLTSDRFPRLMAAIVDLAERDPALGRLHADLTEQQRRPVLELVRRGQEQGAIAADADPEVVVDLLTAPFFYRRLIAHRPLPPTLPQAIVDQVLPRRSPSGGPSADGPRPT